MILLMINLIFVELGHYYCRLNWSTFVLTIWENSGKQFIASVRLLLDDWLLSNINWKFNRNKTCTNSDGVLGCVSSHHDLRRRNPTWLFFEKAFVDLIDSIVEWVLMKVLEALILLLLNEPDHAFIAMLVLLFAWIWVQIYIFFIFRGGWWLLAATVIWDHFLISKARNIFYLAWKAQVIGLLRLHLRIIMNVLRWYFASVWGLDAWHCSYWGHLWIRKQLRRCLLIAFIISSCYCECRCWPLLVNCLISWCPKWMHVLSWFRPLLLVCSLINRLVHKMTVCMISRLTSNFERWFI